MALAYSCSVLQPRSARALSNRFSFVRSFGATHTARGAVLAVACAAFLLLTIASRTLASPLLIARPLAGPIAKPLATLPARPLAEAPASEQAMPIVDETEGSPAFWPGVVETVRVEALRPDLRDRMERQSSFSTHIALGPSVPGTRDLADLLDRTAGLQIHRYGGIGAFTLASVRGSTPGQVRVCLDGVPIAAAGEGWVNLALLPVSHLDHAEIYRGPQMVPFGGPPAAGVVQLVTPRALSAPLRLSLGVGSFDTRLARGQWGRSWRSLGALVSAQYRQSEGDFPYLNRNGTFFENKADDQIVRRRNNDFSDLSLLWKGSFSPRADLRFDYTGQRFERESGIPGTENIQTEKVRFETDRERHQIQGRGRIPGPVRPLLEGTIHREKVRDRFDNREGEVGLGRARTDNRTTDQGGSVALSLPLALLRQEMNLRLEEGTERWTPHDRLRDQSGFTRTRRSRTWVLGDQADLFARRLHLEYAYRWSRARDNYGGPNPIGRPASPSPTRTHRHEAPVYGARLRIGGGLALKGNRGRLVRWPSFPELFGMNGIQDANSSLRPEEGIQWDLGFSLAPKTSLRLETAYFESLVEDQIVLLQNSQRTVKAQNLERAWTRGVETSIYGAVPLPFDTRYELQSNLTWQEAKDVSRSRTYRGKWIPNLPETEIYLSNSFERGGWGLEWELSTRTATFRDRYNTKEKKTPAATIHDLALERSLLGRALRLRFETQNVGDVRVQDIDGFPLPGRSFLMEATWTYGR